MAGRSTTKMESPYCSSLGRWWAAWASSMASSWSPNSSWICLSSSGEGSWRPIQTKWSGFLRTSLMSGMATSPTRLPSAYATEATTPSIGPLGSSEGGSAPLPKPPPDAVRAAGRRGAGALPSEASNLRTAPAKPALEAEHSCSRGHGHYLDRSLRCASVAHEDEGRPQGRMRHGGVAQELELRRAQGRRAPERLVSAIGLEEARGQKGGGPGGHGPMRDQEPARPRIEESPRQP